MENWRKVEDKWINFDYIHGVKVESDEDCQNGRHFYIAAMQNNISYCLFERVFATESEAHEFLNDFMDRPY